MKVLDYLLSMASRTIGVRVDEVSGISERQAFNGLAKLVQSGRAHKAVIAHRHVRYFAHITMRDLFVESLKSDAQPAHKNYRPLEGNAPWDADTPAFMPPGVKVQYGPSHAPRFREHVIPFVHGGLRCA